nr:P-loop NTPase fold protein [uncultured Pseudoxanthomonas sp.]
MTDDNAITYPLSLVLDDSTRPQVRELQRFISREKPSVLVLQGKWGRGKTHLWQSLVRSSVNICRKKYCYVSLFGINTLADLKRTLFERSIPSEDAHRTNTDQAFNVASLKTFWKTNPIRKSAGALSGISNPWTGSLGDQWSSVAYSMLKDHLVCIDDLERRGNGLSLRDVLGVVSQLATEKNCSVAIIANIEQLDDSDKKVWSEQREKVVDRTITYAPDAKAALLTLFGEPHNSHLLKALSVLEDVGCSNLRIASRAISNLDMVLEQGHQNLHQGAKESIARSISVLTYCHEGRADGAPSVEHALAHGRWSGIAAALGKDDKSEEQKCWDDLLEKIQFYPEPIDSELSNFVVNGYLPSTYEESLLQLTRKFEAGDIERAYSEAWETFHGAYGGELEAFAERFYTASLAATPFESAMNIDSSICLLRDLGKDAWAEDCGRAWIEHRRPIKGNPFHMRDVELFRPLQDEWFRSEIVKAQEQANRGMTLSTAFTHVATRMGDQAAAVETIAAATKDELLDWLRSTTGNDLRSAVRATLDGYPVEKSDEASLRLQEALKALALDNPLDRIRVSRIGIDVG